MEICPDIPFDKYKIYISLIAIPGSIEKNGRIAMTMQVKTIKNVSYNILYDFKKEKLFAPWIMMKDKFGGDTPVRETYNINGIITPLTFKFSQYGKFIREYNARFPVWFGYFDNHYQANKEWKKNGVSQLLECAEWERVLTSELENKIKNYKFEKL